MSEMKCEIDPQWLIAGLFSGESENDGECDNLELEVNGGTTPRDE